LILKAATAGFYTYEVTTEDNNGCAQTATITVEVRPAIFEFPNIFTPDGDDLNDKFGPVALGKLKELLSLQVFNRWGELVFNGQGNDVAWDGTHKGKNAPSDAYYFVARIRNPQDQKEEIVRGDVTLLR
jgi:gliding motility-associated-like protein